MKIDLFIKSKLEELNQQYSVSNVAVSEANSIARVKSAMEKANRNLDKVSFDGIEMSREELAQMKIQIPAAFKNKPVRYEATASHFFGDGSLAGKTSFSIDVIL